MSTCDGVKCRPAQRLLPCILFFKKPNRRSLRICFQFVSESCLIFFLFFLPALRVKPGFSVLAGCKVVIRLRRVSADGIEVVLLPLHGMIRICTYIQEMKCFHETAHGFSVAQWEIRGISICINAKASPVTNLFFNLRR